jgi:hypothetical protein
MHLFVCLLVLVLGYGRLVDVLDTGTSGHPEIWSTAALSTSGFLTSDSRFWFWFWFWSEGRSGQPGADLLRPFCGSFKAVPRIFYKVKIAPLPLPVPLPRVAVPCGAAQPRAWGIL